MTFPTPLALNPADQRQVNDLLITARTYLADPAHWHNEDIFIANCHQIMMLTGLGPEQLTPYIEPRPPSRTFSATDPKSWQPKWGRS
jgi:hypothetical protein